MSKQKYYDEYYKYIDIIDIKNSIKHVQNIIENHEEDDFLKELSYDELDNILYRFEKISLSIRVAMQAKDFPDFNSFTNEYSHEIEEEWLGKFNENNPCSVEFNGKTLRLKSPFTLKRMMRDGSLKENYLLANYAKAALLSYQNENKIDLYMSLKAPLVVIIKRKVLSPKARILCDNDNLENGRFINEIFDVFGYPDNPGSMSLYSCAVVVEDEKDCGTEFIVFPKNDLKNHLDEL